MRTPRNAPTANFTPIFGPDVRALKLGECGGVIFAVGALKGD
jgi:hypothetical protein